MKTEMDDLKKVYKQIAPPRSYSTWVQESIDLGKRGMPRILARRRMQKFCAVAAIGLLTFTATLNVNAQFAKMVTSIPVVGEFAKMLTFKTYKEQSDIFIVDAQVPKFKESLKTDFEKNINDTIEETIHLAIEDYKKMAYKNKEAYIETGGDEKTYRPIILEVDYDIRYSKNGILSFIIHQTDTIASAHHQGYYYNLDLVEEREITLEDLIGSDYMKRINDYIKQEIVQRAKEDGMTYFDGFEGIDKNQPFYINEYGEVVIVFEKYEIAPGYMGIQEFILPKEYLIKSIQPSVHYQIESCTLEGNTNINYPKLTEYKDELVMKEINKRFYEIVEKYNKETYSDLWLEYEIQRMDEELLSVNYLGMVKVEDIGYIPIRESINFDLTKEGKEITVENYIQNTSNAKKRFKNLINEKAKEQGIEDVTYENMRMFFRDGRVTFYYMPLEDHVQRFVYLTFSLEEVKDIITMQVDASYNS